MKIAEIIINLPTRAITQPFSYAIPEELCYLAAGWRVIVPFGNQEAEGYVLSTREGSTDSLKQVKSALDDFPWFDATMIRLAEWLARYYLCTLAESMRLFVPGKKGIKTEQYYQIAMNHNRPNCDLFEDSLGILNFIFSKQPVSRATLLRQFGSEILVKLSVLVTSGAIVSTAQTKTREQTHYIEEYRLADPVTVVEMLANYSKRPAQRRLLELIVERGSITKELLKQLNMPIASLQKLIQSGLLTCSHIPQLRNSYADRDRNTVKCKVLSAEQTHCLKEIEATIAKKCFKPFLLHGITGSGKTEIYIEATERTRQQGRQVIILVPEIALTGQIVDRFRNRFGDDIVVFHSKLSLSERYDAWRRLREKLSGIVIGARSAIFAPVTDLGLIVIDEEHEFTYKQEETPRYHARDVAIQRATLANATIILGSATPSVDSYQNALSGEYTLLELTTRADGAVLPNVEVVDMREEMTRGRRSVISEPLATLLQLTIQRKEQAIVLLNRRGHSTFLLCRECGHVMRCRHCAVSLVYHADDQSLRCHYCRRPEQVPDTCPACQSRYIRYFGAGTQKAEEELRRLLPDARLLRMDQDTTGGRFAIDRMLKAFHDGEYDILLGTQMVAKGHDIPNVTAVGILAADSTLNLPDFRAAEKTFALITQAAGRAGRGQKAGSVIIQTYTPEHYAVQAGAAQDYRQFFISEVEFRRSLNYPPFLALIRCTVSSEIESAARRDAEALAAVLKITFPDSGDSGVELLGPYPSTIAKVKDVFRMNILIKVHSALDIKLKLSQLPQIAKSGVTIDVDPYNML